MNTKQFYVYARGIFNLWALVYTTNSINEAMNISKQYSKAKVLTKKMN